MKELISEEMLKQRIEELGKQITKDYQGEEITVLCILKGAAPFTMDLTRKINLKMKFEYMQLSSYLGKESTGKITIKKEIEKELIENQNILIVEDIVDTGRSMQFMRAYLEEKGAKTVKICSLLNKRTRRVVDVKVDYIGFEIEDKFVVGYGLDDNDYDRNIPYVGYIE